MDFQCAATLWQQMWQGLRGHESASLPQFTETETFSSAFAVSELAATSIGIASQALSDLLGRPAPLTINVRLASRWFQQSLRPINRPLPASWDHYAGDYQTADGWIRLHTNSPVHRAALLQVVGYPKDRDALTRIVSGWQGDALEQSVIEAGGCAAVMRSESAWLQHPQAHAVIREPLIAQQAAGEAATPGWSLLPARPLLGVRVLDLTRVIAGPVATRFLASLGADVLRIDPPDWQEPALQEEMTCGKRCAQLDFRQAADRKQLIRLMQHADVLVVGYRADALDKIGLDIETRRTLAPGLIDVSLNAWGWHGPWRNRRGFDSLVQMACGIAERGQVWRHHHAPVPLPVQALDHATGYLIAAAVLEGMRQRRLNGTGWQAQLSLARTAWLLQQHGAAPQSPQRGIHESPQDRLSALELTPWGIAERLRSPVRLPGTPMVSASPGAVPGSSAPCW